jgi:hypothetical protein
MKKVFLSISLICVFVVACKVKATKENSAKENNKTLETKTNEQQNAEIENKTLGKISHQYRVGGCASVIEVKLEGDEVQTLIPKDKLAKEIDVDGKEIYFNFLVLRMPQPQGCMVGQPAIITDIVEKK